MGCYSVLTCILGEKEVWLTTWVTCYYFSDSITLQLEYVAANSLHVSNLTCLGLTRVSMFSDITWLDTCCAWSRGHDSSLVSVLTFLTNSGQCLVLQVRSVKGWGHESSKLSDSISLLLISKMLIPWNNMWRVYFALISEKGKLSS